MSSTLRVDEFYITPEEYLAAERLSETRHEYLAGVVYAMAGGPRNHARITNNLIMGLGSLLAGTPCFPFGPDLRVRIQRPAGTYFYYPDVTVDCSDLGADEITEPTVIFEVLSPSTDRADRGDKLVNYQGIPSLRVYGLVDQQRPIVTVYRRAENEAWAIELYSSLEQVIPMREIGCDLSMTAVYREVFPAGAFA